MYNMAATQKALSSVCTTISVRVFLLVVVTMSILFTEVVLVNGESILGEQNEDFDFDGLPGVQHDFKVNLGAGAEECFYQKVAKGATLYVAFEVLRGGDRNANLIVRNSQRQVVSAEHWKNEGSIEFDAAYEDTYALCLDNTYGRMSSKLVYLYIVVMVKEDWSAYAKELDDLFGIAQNVTHSLSSVENSVQVMRRSQTQYRLHVVRDMYLVRANSKFVRFWSILQCIVIITCSVIQVVFVRRLFHTRDVTPSAKPRA